MLQLKLRYLVGILIITFSTSCTVPIFDQYEYELATILKVDALTVMSKATGEYSLYKNEITQLNINLRKAYEYSIGRKDNEISAAQWEIIKDPKRNSLGGFLKKWEKENTLKSTFIEEAKKLVSDGFNTIILYEGEKAN